MNNFTIINIYNPYYSRVSNIIHEPRYERYFYCFSNFPLKFTSYTNRELFMMVYY